MRPEWAAPFTPGAGFDDSSATTPCHLFPNRALPARSIVMETPGHVLAQIGLDAYDTVSDMWPDLRPRAAMAVIANAFASGVTLPTTQAVYTGAFAWITGSTAVKPIPTTRRPKSATRGVMPGSSAMTSTAGPSPMRKTGREATSAVKVVSSKSARSSSLTASPFAGAGPASADVDDLAIGLDEGQHQGECLGNIGELAVGIGPLPRWRVPGRGRR